jgi:uroporphyrinogen III methyltransferase/synthase
VPDAVLALAGPEAEVVRTEPGEPAGAALVAGSKDGRTVVRLLPGRPVPHAEGAKEAEAVLKGQAAARGRAGRARRDRGARVRRCGARTAAHRRRGHRRARLARADAAPGALVLLTTAARSPSRSPRWSSTGRKPGEAVAVTVGGTTTEQRTVVTTLDAAEAAVAEAGLTGDAVVVVGDPVKRTAKLSWFESRPLYGWRVLVPRTRDQAGALSAVLRSHGAVPVEVPTIAVEPPRTPAPMERAVKGLHDGKYAWIAFTSTNAVRAVREKLEEYGLDARALSGVKVAAVGETTAQALVDFGVRPDLCRRGSSRARACWPTSPLRRRLRPDRPRAAAARRHRDRHAARRAAGARLAGRRRHRLPHRAAAPPPAETREALKGGGFDAVLFTSSSTVRNLVGIAGKPHDTTVLACIGPQTSATAEELGLRVDVLAPRPTSPRSSRRSRRSPSSAGRALPPSRPCRARPTAARSPGWRRRGQARERLPDRPPAAAAAHARAAPARRRRARAPADLVLPVFVKEGIAEPHPIGSMPASSSTPATRSRRPRTRPRRRRRRADPVRVPRSRTPAASAPTTRRASCSWRWPTSPPRSATSSSS